MKSITTEDIYSFLMYSGTVRNNLWSAKARKLSAIKAFFKFLTVKRKLLETNPAIDIESPKPKKSLPKVLSMEEAKALLLNGNYIPTVPEVMPGEVYIAGVELGYRAGARDAYAMPYYRFYVELPGMEQEDGLKTYGAYYVPAVEGRYLTDMPVWDGSFN